MNLTDILLFGKAIVGGGGESDGGARTVYGFEVPNIDEGFPVLPIDETTGYVKVYHDPVTADKLIGGYVMGGYDSRGYLWKMKLTAENVFEAPEGVVGISSNSAESGTGLAIILSESGAEALGAEEGIYVHSDIALFVLDLPRIETIA